MLGGEVKVASTGLCELLLLRVVNCGVEIMRLCVFTFKVENRVRLILAVPPFKSKQSCRSIFSQARERRRIRQSYS